MVTGGHSMVSANCILHPHRKAFGLCVQCRTPICSECSTRVDGINYCQSCLCGLSRTQPIQSLSSSRQFSLSNILLILGGGLLIWGTLYLLGNIWIRL
ncbi:MAG: hypothetical protein AB1611_02400 [bacterium]